MSRLSNSDYKILDAFMRAVLTRVESGKSGVPDALADIMHPLTAWDNGNEQEFSPWMKLKLVEWTEQNA